MTFLGLLFISLLFHDDPHQAWPPPYLFNLPAVVLFVCAAVLFVRYAMHWQIVAIVLLLPVAVLDVMPPGTLNRLTGI